jgi:hypothetical protein
MTQVTGAQRFFEHPEARAAENAAGGGPAAGGEGVGFQPPVGISEAGDRVRAARF